MGEFFKAELKDRFLNYAHARKDYFEVSVLYDEFLSPNYDQKFVERLLREILEYDDSLLDVMSGNGAEIFMLASTPHTLGFLEEGGFLDMHVKEEEKWDSFFNQLSTSKKLSKSERDLLQQKSPSLKRERTLLTLMVSAIIISFLFTLYSILNNTLFKPQYVPKAEFEKRVERLEREYKAENERLEMALQKANATIDSLHNSKGTPADTVDVRK
ncbi:MAG: hypothetical protein AAFU57_09190 [Bacteroidota bacterium]